MSVIATAVKHLLAAGVTGDALVAAIADMEACAPVTDGSAARRREKDAVYQATRRAEAKAAKATPDRRQNRQSRQTSADGADAPSPNDIYSNPLPPPLDCSDEQSTPAVDLLDPVEVKLQPEHVVEAWNEMAGRLGLAKAKLTAERRKKLVSRIRSCPIDDWTEAIGAVERSAFLRGENDKAWRANFDFLLQPTTFTKLIEGTYDRSVQ